MPLLLSLTSCSAEKDPANHLEWISGFPLWEKLLVVGMTSLLSEDLACITAGMLASKGILTFGWALGGAFLGVYLGGMPLYFAGRLGGIDLLRRAPFRWFLKEPQIVQAESLYDGHGVKLIFSARLIPGSRFPIYAAAGLLRYPFWKFALYKFMAEGLAAVILVWGSMRLGEVVFDWFKVLGNYVFPIFVAVLVLTWIVVKIFEIFATRRSRLTFLSRCRKLYYRIRPKAPLS